MDNSRLRYGNEYYFKSGYLSNDAGYLDICNPASCSSQTLYQVTTTSNPERDNFTGRWQILSTTKLPTAAFISFGDIVHLRNGHNNWQGGFLDICNPAKCASDTLYNATTASTTTRGYGTGNWVINSVDGKPIGTPIRLGDRIYFESRYESAFGGYLDVCGPANCSKESIYNVTTSKIYNRDNGSSIWIPCLPVYSSFSYDGFENSRAAYLRNLTDPNTISAKIITSLNSNSNTIDPSWIEAVHAPGYYRAEFVFELGYDIFDAFFNSPGGVRGQFSLGVQKGRNFTHGIMLGAFNSIKARYEEKYPKDYFKCMATLMQPKAKIWMVEAEAGLPDPTKEQIFNVPKWLEYKNTASSHDPICSQVKISDPTEIQNLATWGMVAPKRKKIRFMGVFMNSEGKTWEQPWKERRGLQVSQFGFS
ncbi:hypothetical protein [Flagellimonas sp. S3867]|uniref:hypothetical protein n=1 Tax=Flagellimonas sp. S3867 TaxID=2768063 RepID=UPI0016887EEE|nr:hypothetical protein [Flagellimonas sp. S3867]